MPKVDERNIVFAWQPPKSAGNPATLVVGVPAQAWEFMKDGKTHNLTLESLGIPIRLVLFGAENHAKAMEALYAGARQAGIPMLDERRKDFSIPESDDNEKSEDPKEDKNAG